MKKSISCCSLTSQSTNMFVWSCYGLIFDCKRCLICTYFYPDSDEMTFSLENAMLSRTCILVGSCNDGFDSLNTQFFMSQDVNWWTGVDVDFLWIIVMFLSAVWTLVLMAPIHCRGSIGEQVMLNFSKSVLMQQTNSFTSWMACRWVSFQQTILLCP